MLLALLMTVLLPTSARATSLVFDGYELPLVGLCEPSGAALDAHKVAWIVDDDQDGKIVRWIPGSHVFLDLPLPPPPGGKVPKDAEGAAVHSDGSLYVLGSHSISKGGKLGRRAQLLEVRRGPDDSVTVRSTDALRSKKGPEGLAALAAGLTAVCPDCVLPPAASGDGDGTSFDLEALALLEDPAPPNIAGPPGLYFGLRAPLIGDDALVFRADREALMAHESGPVPVEAAWRLPLGRRGVRALGPAWGGGLLLVAGPPGGEDTEGVGAALYHWMPGALPALLGELQTDPAVGWVEAVVSTGQREAWLLFDEGARLSKKGVPWHRDDKGEFSCGAGEHPEASWARARHVSW